MDSPHERIVSHGLHPSLALGVETLEGLGRLLDGDAGADKALEGEDGLEASLRDNSCTRSSELFHHAGQI